MQKTFYFRLEDAIHEYFHERIRHDQRLLAQEQTENKRLFPVGEDVETIILHLEIIKVRPQFNVMTKYMFKDSCCSCLFGSLF